MVPKMAPAVCAELIRKRAPVISACGSLSCYQINVKGNIELIIRTYMRPVCRRCDIVGLPACTKYRRTWKSRTYEMFYWFLVLEIMLIQKLHDATLASLSNFFYSRFKITFSVQIFT